MNYFMTNTRNLSLTAVTLAVLSCQKSGNDGGNNSPGGSIADAETFSSRLQFFGAAKKPGNAPKGPTGTSLRTSLRDTFYLFDEIKYPVKFLHSKTQNVTGAFVQLSATGGGGLVSHHYDVPETPNHGSDTVSVVLIGIDPADLKVPQVFDITIVPHDASGQPLAQIKRPVKLQLGNNKPNANCGLELPQGQNWRWVFSMTQDGSFINEPFKVHSPGGQDIRGYCCANGSSTLPCPPFDVVGKTLHFATYYQILSETFLFFNNGNFGRFTLEDSPVPQPSQSNFCCSGSGVVLPGLKQTSYNGTWTLKSFTYTASLNAPYLKNDTQLLELKTTSSSGTGFGNPGGVLHQLDCKIGSLVMVQLSNDGVGKHLVKVYVPSSEPLWNAMD